jgi:hypothetical protein
MSPVDTRNSEETMEWMGKTKEIEEQEYHKHY